MNPILPRTFGIRPRSLPLVVTACGALGLLFRLLITVTGLDGKGLMIPWHFSWICMWLVTAAAAVILVIGVVPIHGPATHRASFPRSLAGAGGCILAALSAIGAAMAQLRSQSAAPLLAYLQGGVMLLAAVAFLLVAACRLLGKKPLFLFHVVICAYFAVQMLDLYRTWSFDPQLHQYIFQLFACIALTAMAYQLASFDMGRISHRKLWAWGLAAVYLCCVAAADNLFFITAGVWAFTNLSNLRRPRQRPAAENEIPAAE